MNHVLHEPVPDFTLPSADQLRRILAFIRTAADEHRRTVVHSAGGIGRSPLVVASWLVAARGFAPADAVGAVQATGYGRDPYEAVGCNGVTEAAADRLLEDARLM